MTRSRGSAASPSPKPNATEPLARTLPARSAMPLAVSVKVPSPARGVARVRRTRAGVVVQERGARGLADPVRDGIVGGVLGRRGVQRLGEGGDDDRRAFGLGAQERGRRRIGLEDGVGCRWRAAARGRRGGEVGGLGARPVGVAALQAGVGAAPAREVGHRVEIRPADGDRGGVAAVVEAREAAGDDVRDAGIRRHELGLAAHDHEELARRQRQRPRQRLGRRDGVAEHEASHVHRPVAPVDDLDPLVVWPSGGRVVHDLVDDDLASGGRLREGRAAGGERREGEQEEGARHVAGGGSAPEARTGEEAGEPTRVASGESRDVEFRSGVQASAAASCRQDARPARSRRHTSVISRAARGSAASSRSKREWWSG